MRLVQLASIGVGCLLLAGALAPAEGKLSPVSVPVKSQLLESEYILLDTTGPRPAVQISLDGGPPLKATFDTGATTTTANIQFAAELKLKNEGPIRAPFDKHNLHEAYQSTLRNLAVDGVLIGNVSVPVMPSPLPDSVAILSPNLFKDRLLELDLGQSCLAVMSRDAHKQPNGAPHSYSPAPFSLPTVLLEIDAQAYSAHLDTGSPVGLLMPLKYSKLLALSNELQLIGMACSHFGETPVYKARIKGKVMVGPLILIDPEVRFTDTVPEINIGTQLLKELIITLDPAKQRFG